MRAFMNEQIIVPLFFFFVVVVVVVCFVLFFAVSQRLKMQNSCQS